MAGNYSKLPGGNIKPNSFVKLDSANDGYVLQAGANDRVYGITGDGTRRVALEDYDTDLIGKAGDPAIQIRGPGENPCLLRLAGTVVAGDYIKSDGSGYGVKADTDKDHYGARAIVGGSSGQVIPVEVIIGDLAV